jgi:hypothetical protein
VNEVVPLTAPSPSDPTTQKYVGMATQEQNDVRQRLANATSQRDQLNVQIAALLERIAEAGGGVGVTDAAQHEAVAELVRTELGAWWERMLAAGSSPRMGQSALASAQGQRWIGDVIDRGLAEQSYLSRTRTTKMRADLDRWWEQDSLMAEYVPGREPPRPAWERYPSLRRSMARWQAQEARRQTVRDELGRFKADQDFWHDANRHVYEAEHARRRTRKLGS